MPLAQIYKYRGAPSGLSHVVSFTLSASRCLGRPLERPHELLVRPSNRLKVGRRELELFLREDNLAANTSRDRHESVSLYRKM